MQEEGLQYIQFPDEVSRLRYIIDKFKEYDAKRKRYIVHLENMYETQREKTKRLESLTARQHEEIDELIDAYDSAKPLIADKKHKAYIYELIKRSTDSSKNKKEAERLADENIRLKFAIKDMKDKIIALETIIKNLHNGK